MFGIGVSPGISIGKACIIKKSARTVSGILLESEEMRRSEIERFDNAVNISVEEIEALKREKNLIPNQSETDIIETQIEFLTDPQIRTDVADKINNESKTAFDAVIEVINAAAEVFGNFDDEYLRARAADIRDIGDRLLKNLTPGAEDTNNELNENTILIAEEITPSDSLAFDISKIAGFATLAGGKTSHTAIIARSRGIPAIVACGKELMMAENDDVVIIDGSTGEVIIKPDQETIEIFRGRQRKYAEEMSLLKRLKDLPAITADGHRVTLSGNIANADDLDLLFENGGEGVGLLRTELLFMGRNSLPDEEEQFKFYKQVAIKSKNKPVIIRTLDIGGDKRLPYFDIPIENNPFMGYRAIRISLNHKEIFLTQLRAILRASAYGNLKIMFPMICNISEVRKARGCVEQVKNELLRSGTEFDINIETGIMIEIPGAAIIADQLAGEVDFFSIGTNDLCQYTLAVDRMNEKVASLYTHFNPAVLRLIKYAIDQAHNQNIHAGLCGEMASDPLATLLLLGMGLEEFSMGAASIPVIKNIIIKSQLSKAGEVYDKVKEMDSSDEIIKYLKELSA